MPQKPSIYNAGEWVIIKNMFGSKVDTSLEKIKSILERRTTAVFPDRNTAERKLGEGAPLRIYLGIDPTGPSLHIGHTVALLLLKSLADLGHKPVLLIGDFTAKIGDPTGKDESRKPLSSEEIRVHMKDYISQASKVFGGKRFDVEYNSSWLGKMSFADVLELTSHATVQQMMARDMFQERIRAERPIGVHEFLYPLMQGYDSVAMNIDGEVGGNDQTFNMLVGRDLMKDYLGKDKLVFATPLLVDSKTGKKMSKTEGGLIALGDVPSDVYGKTMSQIPDEMIKTTFELCTEVEQKVIDSYQSAINLGENPMTYKKKLARELTRMYHGEKAADQAAETFEEVFSKGELPSEMPAASRAGESIVGVIVAEGLAESKGEAKRLIDQGGVTINEEKATWGSILKSGDIIRVGPRKFLKVK